MMKQITMALAAGLLVAGVSTASAADADNPFTVRLRPAKFPPDAHAIRQ